MRGIIWIVLQCFLPFLRRQWDLVTEIIALWHQLAAFKSEGRQPLNRATGRAFRVVLRRVCSRWTDASAIAKPVTVIRWHRAGFKLC